MRVFSFILILFLLTSSLFARAGFGSSCGLDLSTETDSFVSATFKTDTNPWCIFLNAHFTNPIKEDFSKTQTFTFNLDDWFVNERIAEHVDFYILWGISGGFFYDFNSILEKKDFSIGTGSRFGGGLDFFFCKRHLEFFTQVVWNPYIGLKRENNEYGLLFRPVNFPCSVGIRIWN